MTAKEERRLRIEAQMRQRRIDEEAFYSIDQSKPGWSEGMTWQELLDSRTSGRLNVGNL